jgi:hypothetical protein
MKNDEQFFDDMLADAENREVDPQGMKKLSELAIKLCGLRQEKEALESRVGLINKEMKELEENLIPVKMAEMGVAGFHLETGESVLVKDHVHANIPKKYENEAFKWLEDNGFGGLIKSEIKAALERGQTEKAREIIAALKEQGVENVELKNAVQWNTLTAFVKEQLGLGASVPMEILGVYIGKKVVIEQ